MGWIDAELALTAIGAMLSPTTLSFSVLALVLGERPLRRGVWFYLGALSTTLAVGVLAAFVLGNNAASTTPYPKLWVAVIDVVAAGATLANPGAFIPLALKDISETNPSTTGYVIDWVFFSVVSLLPLAVALIMLAVSPDRATRLLQRVRDWLLRNARLIAAAIMVLLAAALLRDGISGLTHMS